ncbi:similar to Saccharomyces cerevisiae YJR134C SGM1 Protein of unknown function, required for wild-type growth rate on galactose and mannose [Maudiozyma saulgeensis]|uniref:TATA element modulatory factor 1 TATA binding domain-containing protein n=1 Tax=Maudiozyma saulgeensis TaxID=1789683 RepID=A0A1X7R8J6_9SACH|nr:similar to Saccharomyces cerevisiae YJR134C SGM1 Protein of unknown function, required for wild-type growth rate on galactose and mannose [Kazachstania saulgeensis]
MSSAKKLSLEERLSLAAKKGKKKSKKLTSASPTPGPLVDEEIATHVEETSPDVKEGIVESWNIDETVKTVSDSKKDVETSVAPETVKEEVSPVQDEQSPKEVKTSVVNTVKLEPLLIQNLKLDWLPNNYRDIDVHKLLNTIDQRIGGSIEKGESSNKKLLESIKEKDKLIGQLRSEGENLSKVDLKKSNQIKLMKSKMFEMENDLLNTKEQLDEEVSNYKTLEKNLNDLQQQVVTSNSVIKDLKLQVTTVEKLQSTTIAQDSQIATLKEEVADMTTQLAEANSNHLLEIESLRESSSAQINTLETDLEQLKIKLENKNQSETTSGEPQSMTNDSQQYYILEQQLRSSKENWKSIEDTFNIKIVKLEEALQNAEQEVQKQTQEKEKLANGNGLLIDQIDNTLSKNKELKDQVQSCKNEVQSLQNKYNDMKDDYNLLNNKFSIQKAQLTKLYDEPITNSHLKLDTSNISAIKSHSLNDVSEEWLLPADDSLLSIQSISTNIDNSRFDDTDTPPRVDNNVNESDVSISIDIPDDAEHLQNMLAKKNSRSSNQLNVLGTIRPSDSSLTPNKLKPLSEINNNTEINSGSMNTNPQLVTRLGSEVRRLENELRNMQKDQERLVQDKDNANEEILRLLDRNDKAIKIIDENKSLKQELENISKRLEVSLQLLGEKSETVEELENDVNDLKEMIKQQVQQMVEIQESK